ncbi:MAG: hypothetical protein RJB24_652 [Candidatus Parcubacteria bacterium]|jgi:hypothetical protein
MIESQRHIKKIIIASIYLLIAATIIFFIVINFFPPTPIVVEDKPLIQSLQVTRSGKVDLGNGLVDFWAEISNPNDDFGASNLEYSFVLTNSNGEEITKNGDTFILPGDKRRYVLLFDISSEYELQRFEINQDPEWTQLSRFNLPELVIRNTKIGDSPKVGNDFTAFGTLTNASPVNLKNIEVIAVITDDKDNIIGVNRTIIRDVLTLEARDFEMTWQNEVVGTSIFNTKIYAQSNVLNNRALLIELQQTPIFDR